MRIYLDNNATTRMHPDVLETFSRVSGEAWGNPSSVHAEGRRARRVLEESRDLVAEMIGSDSKNIVFTSGGTEANNAALYGVALASPECCHIVTTAIEHPAVLGVVRDLERRGHPVTCVAPDRRGVVDADEVIDAIRPETGLVSMMLANNETGVIQPVAEVARHCREAAIHFHCDAVQAIGKIPVSVDALEVDSLSLSAHKFHGPKGVGVLYVRSGVTLRPYLIGGSQERRRRAGTEPVPVVAAMGAAAKVVLGQGGESSRVAGLRDAMEMQLLERIPRVAINGAGAERLPNTTNLRIEGCDSESMVIALDLEGIAVSGGSACSSGRVEGSHVLLAMGLTAEEASCSFRVSLSRDTTREEVARFVDAAERIVTRIRSSSPIRA